MEQEDLLYILKEHKNIKRGIELSKKRIFSFIETEEDIIRQLVLPGHSEITFKNNTNTDKILGIVQMYHQQRKQQIKEFRNVVSFLSMEEECLNKIFICLYKLKEPKRSILILLFIENYTWESICKMLHISSSSLWRIRNEALKDLLDIYENMKNPKNLSKYSDKFLGFKEAEQLILKNKKV